MSYGQPGQPFNRRGWVHCVCRLVLGSFLLRRLREHATPEGNKQQKHILKKSAKRVSCEFDESRVDTHLCKLYDNLNFANTMEELD